MSLTKKVYLTISGYDIKLSDNLTFYQKDQLKLIFYINEYGIDYENNATARALMPVNPLNAILFIENPDGVDSVSSAKIEDNAVTFYLDSTHTQYVGVSRMQLRLFDQDGCAITLPHFTFEIRENIYGSGDVRFQNVVMVDQTGTVILTEDNDMLDVGDVLTMGTEVAYPQVTKTIKELPIKHGLDGTEKLIVEDNEATKQASLGTIVDEIKQNSQEKIREIESELAQTNAQLSRNGYVYPEEFGAVGDGETDDTQSIQSAIDYCKMNDKTLKLVPGNVYIISSLTGYCGMRLYGNGGTLKLISNSPKYRLMLTIGESSDDDRNLTSTIRDVIFDGNCFNQGDFDNYEKEQQIGIMVSHTNYQNDENKTKVNISNCQFNNFCGDGTHVFVNSIVNFSNIIAQDCFRGGIVASGAWSHINIDNFQCHSTFGKSIDVEIDSREADEEYICVNLNNVNTNVRLDLQLTDGCKSELSTINASNLICTGPLLLGSSYGQTKISNSTLSSVKCENCKDVTFDNVTFLANLSSDADYLVLVQLYDYLINEGVNKNDFVATFNNCKFKRIDGKNYVLDKYISCYRQSINIANTYFLNGANIGVYLWVCAKNKLENTFFNTAQGVVLKDSAWDRMTRNELLNLSFGDSVEKEIRLMEDSNTQTVLSGVVEKASDFRVFGDTKYADFSNCYSNRILISDIDPTTEATPGYVGDRIRSKKYYTNSKEYICTKSSNESATWREV